MGTESGVLPIQTLKRMISSNYLSGIGEQYLNPASVDLPLSEEAYRLEGVSLPRRGESVRELIHAVGASRHDLKSPLEVGVPYLIRLEGSYELPESVYGYANPKSSTGRINLFCRIVADGVDMYDALTPAGFKGDVWVLAQAESFPVLLSPGQAVSQLRLFDGKTFLDPLELDFALNEHGLFFEPNGNRIGAKKVRKHAEALLLSLSLCEEMVGWECRGSNKVLDFGKIGHYFADEFFKPIAVRDGALRAYPGSFYILSTLERVMVPPLLSAELRAIEPRFGEFRSHAAGYIDPGWGWGESGEACGRPITLEITPYKIIDFRHGQTIARVRYERMRERPETLYDGAKSNYVLQKNAALSKHFQLA